MTAWLRKELTFGNVMMIIGFLLLLFRSTGQFAYDLNSSTSSNTQAIANNVESQARLAHTVESLSLRVESMEKSWLLLNEVVAKDFPRRSELEPRLLGIEKQLEQNNMLSRRLYERYTAPGWRAPK